MIGALIGKGFCRLGSHPVTWEYWMDGKCIQDVDVPVAD